MEIFPSPVSWKNSLYVASVCVASASFPEVTNETDSVVVGTTLFSRSAIPLRKAYTIFSRAANSWTESEFLDDMVSSRIN